MRRRLYRGELWERFVDIWECLEIPWWARKTLKNAKRLPFARPESQPFFFLPRSLNVGQYEVKQAHDSLRAFLLIDFSIQHISICNTFRQR